MADIDKLKIDQARLDQYQEILNISKNVYEGMDYIPNVYHKWIKEEEEHPERRRNLVLLDENGQVRGFQSYLFQDNGLKVLSQALRIDPNLKGQGHGRRFMNLCYDFLIGLNPEVVELKAVWHEFLPNDGHLKPSMGKIIGSRIFLAFHQIGSMAVGNNVNNNNNKGILSEISRGELGKMFESNRDFFRERVLCDDKYIILAWIPYLARSPSDFDEQMTRPLESEIRILVNKDKETSSPISLSVLSVSFIAIKGPIASIDLFTSNMEEIKIHVRDQLDFVIQYSKNNFKNDENVVLWISCEPGLYPECRDFFRRDLRLVPRPSVLYPTDSKLVPQYFVFEKPLKHCL